MQSVDVSFEAKTADVTMKSGKTLTQAECQRAFEGSRYTVKSFESLATAK